MGINAARHLASHGVHTIVYIVSSEVAVIKKELSLYILTKNQVVYSVSNLPNFADLIIVALCEKYGESKSYPDLCDWATRNRAPILALDPPSVGIPGITPKFSLLPVLPLPHSSKNGKLYLCNLDSQLTFLLKLGLSTSRLLAQNLLYLCIQRMTESVFRRTASEIFNS
ncbi:hypothetical protein Zmor_020788 [Zophobas morio]|uniref:Enhancer of mRNA-decapping protein 3 n=1 Tax=Zophobas morio TaxID=2755281 RepID=A0AA38MAD5_9CUCU|nr:hypothetical protein Zmor_020788 [Zophobas morio]